MLPRRAVGAVDGRVTSRFLRQDSLQAADSRLHTGGIELGMAARLRESERPTIVVERDLRLTQVLETDREVEGVIRVVWRKRVCLEIRGLCRCPLAVLGVQIAQAE